MIRILTFFIPLIFVFNYGFAKNNLPFGYEIGDSFVCQSDSLITIGQNVYQNAKKNGEIVEYQNVSFGLRINEEAKGIFSESYPLNPLGKPVAFEIRSSINGIRFDINDYFFAFLETAIQNKYILTGFHLALRPTIIHATCDKF